MRLRLNDISASVSSHIRKMSALRSPAAERNKEPISNVLRVYLEPRGGRVLEVASGCGTHVMHFSRLFPNTTWHPTDVSERSVQSIVAHMSSDVASTGNVMTPVLLDVCKDFSEWPASVVSHQGKFDCVLNANMVHISAWDTAVGLFAGAGRALKPDGFLLMYGPFAFDGVLQPQSNVDFDHSLRLNDSRWGVRDVRNLEHEAAKNSLVLHECHTMPANNHILAWKKASTIDHQ